MNSSSKSIVKMKTVLTFDYTYGFTTLPLNTYQIPNHKINL